MRKIVILLVFMFLGLCGTAQNHTNAYGGGSSSGVNTSDWIMQQERLNMQYRSQSQGNSGYYAYKAKMRAEKLKAKNERLRIKEEAKREKRREKEKKQIYKKVAKDIKKREKREEKK